MNLSDTEKETIIDFIKNNEPLPKEYIYKLFADEEDVFLFWNGRSEDVTNVVLPFHSIEHIDEPRKEVVTRKDNQLDLFSVDTKGRQLMGWTNKLIWGDNKLVLSSLVNGPMRDEIEKEGGLKLIYIDPPFAVGADFSFNIEINGESAEKKQSIIEEIAYRDTWGKGISSYLSMMYERLKLMWQLLDKEGSICVHCDWRAAHFLKCLLDDVFSKENLQNEIIWYYPDKFATGGAKLDHNHDIILHYSRTERYIANKIMESKDEPTKRALRKKVNGKTFDIRDEDGQKIWVTYTEKKIDDVWRIGRTKSSDEQLPFPTQKPEAILERIIKASSKEGDLVADFFCFTPSSLILTKNGFAKIENVNEGDHVLSHSGIFSEVLKKYQRNYNGKVIFIKPRKLPGTFVTPNHPILAIKTTRCLHDQNIYCKPSCRFHKKNRYKNCPKYYENYQIQWLNADQLEIKDIICMPKIKELGNYQNINLEIEEFKSKHINAFNQPNENYLQLSESIYRLIGYYLAEGFVDKRTLKFAINKKEVDFSYDIKHLIRTIFNIDNCREARFKIWGNGIQLLFASVFLCNFFKQFGAGAENKYIPDYFMNTEESNLLQLLCGFIRGDGSGNSEGITFTTVSPQLAGQLFTIGYKLGYAFGLGKRLLYTGKTAYELTLYGEKAQKLRFLSNLIRTGKETKPSRRIFNFVEDEKFYYLPIKAIKEGIYEGQVFNLSIKDDNSYWTEIGIVHNCGSGTTPAVAEKLNRKWIACDLGRFAVHTTRKRLIAIQRQQKEDSKDFRAFEVLNLGKYERQFFMTKFIDNSQPPLSPFFKGEREQAYISLILEAYKAQPIENHRTIHGKKANRMIHVGPLDVPVTKTRLEDIFEECKEKLYTSVDVLGFEFEMGLVPYMQQELREKGVDIRLRYIPKEVFDKRVVEKGQAKFYDVSYLSARPNQVDKKKITVTLMDFITNYTQDDIEDIEQSMRSGSKVIIENGQIVKLTKDKDGIMKREVLTDKWSDWIDYWSVDFDYSDKKEIIKIKVNNPLDPPLLRGNDKSNNEEFREVWTGNYIFENEWQSFRTKKSEIEFTSAPYIYEKAGRYKLMVKVVDILGIDTSQVIEVTVK